MLNRHFAEPFKTALSIATTKTKVLAEAHLGGPLLSSFFHCFLGGFPRYTFDWHMDFSKTEYLCNSYNNSLCTLQNRIQGLCVMADLIRLTATTTITWLQPRRDWY